MFAAAAMSLSSVTVVSNALRLRFFQPSVSGKDAQKESAPVELIMEKGELNTMKKTIQIEGMMCAHCTAHVEKALSNLAGVSSVKADLSGKCATVELSGDVADDALKAAVVEAGYEVTGIS